MAGAFLAIHLTGGTLNVYSQIGLVTLIGLITKHGILIVEFANKAWAEGATRREAALQAAELRLRPILMTTAAMVLGAVPLALAARRGCREPPADRLGDRRRHDAWARCSRCSCCRPFMPPCRNGARPRQMRRNWTVRCRRIPARGFRPPAIPASRRELPQMIVPGPRNSLTDIAGLPVGNAEDHGPGAASPSSCPTGRCWRRWTCAAARRSPSTPLRSTRRNIVKALHGLVLSGGSAFGLDAAGGLTSWLAVRGRGILLDGCCIPTVSGAILYDLANGGDKAWGETPPYRALAVQAAEAAGPEFALGNAGAGLRRHRRPDQGRPRHCVGGRSDHRRHHRGARRGQSRGLGDHARQLDHVGLAPGAGGRARRPDRRPPSPPATSSRPRTASPTTPRSA